MIIIMQPDATDEQISHVSDKLKKLGFGVHLSKGATVFAVGFILTNNEISIVRIILFYLFE